MCKIAIHKWSIAHVYDLTIKTSKYTKAISPIARNPIVVKLLAKFFLENAAGFAFTPLYNHQIRKAAAKIANIW